MNLNMVMWKNSYFEEIHAEIFKVKSNRSLLLDNRKKRVYV